MHLVGLFAHPDDESWAAGGLLASAADDGAEVSVVCATAGEAGVRVDPSVEPRRPLAELRRDELDRACQALGVAPAIGLGLADGGLAASAIELDAALASTLDRLAPEVVVTLGRDGGYGHRDHLALTAAVDAALGRRPTTRLLHAVFPRGLFAPIWASLRRLRPSPIATDIGADDLGVDAASVDLSLDITPLAGRKRAAIAAHRSQLAGADPDSFLRPGLLSRLLEREWFAVASGPPLPPRAEGPFADL